MPRDDWKTPEYVLELLPRVDLDPCSSEDNPTQAERFLTAGALHTDWALAAGDVVFMNPPYSRGSTLAFLRKLLAELSKQPAAEAYVLIKLDCTLATRTLNRFADLICIPYERIQFDGQEGSGVSFPTYIGYLGPRVDEARSRLQPLGRVLK